jgi:transposase-like protein
VLLSVRHDLAAARRFFTRALRAGTIPAEVTTDRARVYPRVLDELIPTAHRRASTDYLTRIAGCKYRNLAEPGPERQNGRV